MGNTSSTNTLPSSHSQTLSKKRSVVFSKLVGCNSISSSHSTHEKQFGGTPLIDEQRSSTEKGTLNFAYSPSYSTSSGNTDPTSLAFEEFLKVYPEYRLTWILDTLRRTDFARLERTGEAYVDYMGGALYPESLIKVHTDFLSKSVLGNTHSVSNSSKLSLKYADDARSAVLSFFRASDEYTVIFTGNATGALKLVGESYPFKSGSAYVLGEDSHNSVNGIREFAQSKGAETTYIPSMPAGGVDKTIAKDILLRHKPQSKDLNHSLFALTGQSNITNSKNDLSLVKYAASLGYHTLLDAAALAPTTSFSVTDIGVDAMAISFYKMFGFPTGVGALIVKKSLLVQLQRPWFAGGTVDVVQVPGTVVTRAFELHEQFEDGTINYLTLPAVTDGIRFLTAYLPFLPLRLSCLVDFLATTLSQIRHETTQIPVCKILSRLPSRRLKSIGVQSDVGSIVSLIFIGPDGKPMSNAFIEYTASKHKISLRTGCMCNPGGASALLGIEEEMRKLYPGATLLDFENRMGHKIGVVRISLGLASNFQDVWRVLEFATLLAKDVVRQTMLNQWKETFSIGQAL